VLADGNAKLTAAMQAKNFQMASIAQAIIEAGQKNCKAAREQLESIESEKRSINRKRKRLVTSASEPCRKKHSLTARCCCKCGSCKQAVNHKTAEEHIVTCCVSLPMWST